MESDISVDIAQLIASSSASEDEKNEMAMLLSLNSMSHLHVACLLGSIDAVKKSISSGADVNSRVTNSYNWCKKSFDISKKVRENSTPLHLAVEFNHTEVVEYLLEQTADVYAQDSLGFTPIHLLMSMRYLESKDLSRMLLATPNLRDSLTPVGLSHLHVAARADDPEAVDKLLLNGAQVDCVIDVNAKKIDFLDCYAGKTPLFLARSNATVKRLLEAGANMDAKDLEGISALQHSLRCMDSEPIAEFIRAVKKGRGDVESCGMTLLHVACGYLDIEWVRMLLRKGANANAKIRDKGNQLRGATPLHMVLNQHAACANSYETLVEFVELLINNGADVSIKYRGDTVLHYFYRVFLSYYVYDDVEVDAHLIPDMLRTSVLLLRNLESYDVNPANPNGFSHFHLACLVNDVESAIKFLDCGVDVNEPMNSSDYDDNCYGLAPLHFAMIHRSADVAYLLLKRGANVNVEDVNGNTPLHLAVKRKFVDLPLVELMINRGADVNAKNKDGESFLYLLWKSKSDEYDN